MKHTYYNVVQDEIIFLGEHSRDFVMAPIKQLRNIPMNQNQIIEYLEEENEQLHKTLKNLKHYCGNDYVTACKELEIFLKGSRVKV